MNLTVNALGEIIIDVAEVFDATNYNFKLELIERLSCEDAVITHVMEQVFSGLTENGYSGSEVSDDLRISTPLQQAREKVRQQGNRLLLEELSRLRGVIENRHKYSDAGWNMYHKLYNQVHGLN